MLPFSESERRKTVWLWVMVIFRAEKMVQLYQVSVFVSNVRLMVGGCIVLLQGACVGGSGLKQKLDCCTN